MWSLGLIVVGVLAGAQGQLYASISADYAPVNVHVDGESKVLQNRNDWSTPSQVYLGKPKKGDCVTVAISFNNPLSGGWLKASFDNGDQTDSSWKCSTSAPSDWAQPGFDDSGWAPASQWQRNPHVPQWNWNPAAQYEDFRKAPVIWHAFGKPYGPRYCRKKICSKCSVETCYSCEGNNPCQPLAKTSVFLYPHHNPAKFVQCSDFGQCWNMPCAPGTTNCA